MDSHERELFKRLVVAVEGLLKINESMAEESVRVETEGGAPICPHCSQFNPEIELAAEFSGSGPFGEFGMLVNCKNCQKSFCALPDGWAVFKDQDEFIDALKARSQLMESIGEN